MEKAIRVHLYPVKLVLMPRGSMEKESLGESIYNKLISVYEHWTDEKYGDRPSEAVLLTQMKANLFHEIHEAQEKFIQEIGKR